MLYLFKQKIYSMLYLYIPRKTLHGEVPIPEPLGNARRRSSHPWWPTRACGENPSTLVGTRPLGWEPLPKVMIKLVVIKKLWVKIVIAVVCFKPSFLGKKTGLLDIIGKMPIEEHSWQWKECGNFSVHN